MLEKKMNESNLTSFAIVTYFKLKIRLSEIKDSFGNTRLKFATPDVD